MKSGVQLKVKSGEAESNGRLRAQLFTVIFLAYVGYYFGRVTLPVSVPLLQQAFGFSSTQVGFILSAYFGTYALGKALNGFFGDRIGGKTILTIGLVGTCICNAMFGFGRELAFFTAVWALNAYFQSMGWLGLVPIMARWYSPAETGRAMGLISLSYQVGDVVARFVAATLLLVLVWNQLFWAHAVICAATAWMVIAFLKPTPPADDATAPRAPAATAEKAGYAQWTQRMLSSPKFWTVCVVYLLLSMVRYIFWGWSVDYLASSGSGIGAAVLTSAVFPLAGSAGTLFAGWLSDRLHARRGPVVACMSLALVLSLYAFSQVPPDNAILVVITLGLIGFSLYGPYSLMAGAIAIDFGAQHSSATAAGIIDAVGAAGVILTGVGMGALLDRFGWADTLQLVVLLGGAATIASLALWRLNPTTPDDSSATALPAPYP